MERPDFWPGNVGERELDTMASGPIVTILGDPASLYVCSDKADDDGRWDRMQIERSADAQTRAMLRAVVTGSTAPRVPFAPETTAEIGRLADRPSLIRDRLGAHRSRAESARSYVEAINAPDEPLTGGVW